MSESNYPSQKWLTTLNMKRLLALMVSVLVYIGLFRFFFSTFMGVRTTVEIRMIGFALAIISYFLIAGSLFYHYLKLKWWQLWVAMNIVGFFLSTPVLQYFEPWQEEIDFILLLMFLIPFLCIAWGIVGIGFICVRFVVSHLLGKQ